MSEEEIKTQLDENVSESLSSDEVETEYSQALNPPLSDSNDDGEGN